MRNGTSYEVQVRLADQTTALLTEGVLLRPTEFELRAELQNATAVSGQLVRSRARGGGGYVCCGAVKSFVMPHVPETHALAVEFNLTGGMVRALFLKHGACAAPAVDIRGAQCGTEHCEMSWLTVFDEFYGSPIYSSSAKLDIAFGPTPWMTPSDGAVGTERRAGDWYISIASLPGRFAEFDLLPILIEPPRAPAYFECNRFLGFCPKDYYHFGLGNTPALLPPPPPVLVVELTSGAAPRASVAQSSLALCLCFVTIVARRCFGAGSVKGIRW